MKRFALLGSAVGGLLVAFYVALPLIAAEPEPVVSAEVPVRATPTATSLPLTPTPFVPVASPTPIPKALPALGGKCLLHGDLLQRDSVIILYGLPSLELVPLYEARNKHFPNSMKDVGGGCIPKTNQTEYENVLFCPTCRTEEEKWLALHPEVKARMDEGKQELIR